MLETERFNPEEVSRRGLLFGLPYSLEESRLVIIGVPWEVTVTYKGGTSETPEQVLLASNQIDLFHPELGTPWKSGIAWDNSLFFLKKHSQNYSPIARQYLDVLERTGADPNKSPELLNVAKNLDVASNMMLSKVEETVKKHRDNGKIIGLVGGEHTISIGSVRALSSKMPISILHLDAHADMRPSYAGMQYTHASTIYHISRLDNIKSITSVGIRSLSPAEFEIISSQPNFYLFTAHRIWERVFKGVTWDQLAEEIISSIDTDDVYVTFDIDSLESSLCPSTGTPVPGGLTYAQAIYLIKKLVWKGRRIVGFDIVEGGNKFPFEIDLIVNLLFELSCWTLYSQNEKSS
ncbi:MAG: hypothetical protein GXO48_01370 [Chlorobi bacterium]|nr:hypothetical protein [Chlorobiota bacterium]